MRSKLLLAVLCLAVAAPASALQDDDIASKIINDPSAPQVVGAKSSLRNDANVQGGKALRIQVPAKAKIIGTRLPAVRSRSR